MNWDTFSERAELAARCGSAPYHAKTGGPGTVRLCE